MHYLPHDTSAIATIAAQNATAEHPTPIRAELYGSNTATAAGAPSRDVVTARNEGVDWYPGLVAQIDAQTRVIECAARIQWIVQRSVVRARGREWRGVSFCRTKQALLRCVRKWVPGEHLSLEALPDWFPADRVPPPIAPNDLAATPLAEPLPKTPSAERADEALRQLEMLRGQTSSNRGGQLSGTSVLQTTRARSSILPRSTNSPPDSYRTEPEASQHPQRVPGRSS